MLNQIKNPNTKVINTKDVSDIEYPTHQISEASAKRAQKALIDRPKAIKVTDVRKFVSRSN